MALPDDIDDEEVLKRHIEQRRQQIKDAIQEKRDHIQDLENDIKQLEEELASIESGRVKSETGWYSWVHSTVKGKKHGPYYVHKKIVGYYASGYPKREQRVVNPARKRGIKSPGTRNRNKNKAK
ncbi:MAG: hypothetical protein ACFFD4_02410 [Candidatus Odinarchaeota archaeon]